MKGIDVTVGLHHVLYNSGVFGPNVPLGKSARHD